MARKLSEEYLRELEALKLRCTFVIDFLDQEGGLGALADEFRAAIQQAYEKRDLRGLRILKGDFDDWIKDLPSADRAELEALLRLKLGVDVGAEHDSELETVKSIVARGRVRNEREYRIVQTRIEEIADDPSQADEVRKLSDLLAAY